MKLSCIILTADSSIEKGFCFRHSIKSVLNQEYLDFEIIIVDNSKLIENSQKIIDYLSSLQCTIPYSLYKPKDPLSRGAARSFWAKFASWDFLVFLDDDAILLNNSAFTTIAEYSQYADFWYWAKRLWTENNNWFQKNAEEILIQMERDQKYLYHHLQEAPKEIRGVDHEWLQNFSFIGHFGFCSKILFERIWGFPDFQWCDFEDDYLMYKCFKAWANFVSLESLIVAHVTHPLNKNNSNILIYYNLLKKDGVFWFHPWKPLRKEDPIEYLNTWHLDYRVLSAYEAYKTIFNAKNQHGWMQLYSFQDYVILLNTMLNSETIDSFVKNSRSDFDSLIPILESWLLKNFLGLSNHGKLIKSLNFSYFPNNASVSIEEIIPKIEFNQFPCDELSRRNRLELIKERFPLTDYLRIALLWDDDQLSLLLAQESWLDVITIEGDREIIDALQKYKFDNLEIIIHDFRDEFPKSLKKVKTFLIDPPYTKHWVLLFLYRGLELIDFQWNDEEFFLILNRWMAKPFYEELLTIFAKCNIYIEEIRKNFSTYRLPKNFDESFRVKAFLSKHNIQEDVLYSSASDLYILRSKNPDLKELQKYILNELIYDHASFNY